MGGRWSQAEKESATQDVSATVYGNAHDRGPQRERIENRAHDSSRGVRQRNAGN